jgi:hypothetical protein
MLVPVKIAILQIAVYAARVNRAFPTSRTNCRAGTAVNFSVVHLSKKLLVRRDYNSPLLTLAVALLTLAVALFTSAVALLTLAVLLLTLVAPPAANFSSGW